MYLQDILRVCLYGLNSRYPEHILDINGEIIDIPEIEQQGWKAHEIVELLDEAAPAFLQKMALMHIESDETAIYLPEISPIKPAFWIHCLGKISPHHASHPMLGTQQ